MLTNTHNKIFNNQQIAYIKEISSLEEDICKLEESLQKKNLYQRVQNLYNHSLKEWQTDQTELQAIKFSIQLCNLKNEGVERQKNVVCFLYFFFRQHYSHIIPFLNNQTNLYFLNAVLRTDLKNEQAKVEWDKVKTLEDFNAIFAARGLVLLKAKCLTIISEKAAEPCKESYHPIEDAIGALFHDYEITDETLIFHTLESLAKSCSLDVLMTRVNIDQEFYRYELAKLAAKKDGDSLAISIKKFELHNPEYLLDVARICLMHGTSTAIRNLAKFNITNSEDLLELAKLSAARDPDFVLQRMHFLKRIFNISTENQEALYTIGQVAIRKTSSFTYVETYLELLKENDHGSLILDFILYHPYQINEVIEKPLFKTLPAYELFLCHDFNTLKETLHKSSLGKKWADFKAITLKKEGASSPAYLRWISSIINLVEIKQIDWVNYQELFTPLIDYRDPLMRLVLTDLAFEAAQKDPLHHMWQQWITHPKPKKDQNKCLEYLKLAALCMTSLPFDTQLQQTLRGCRTLIKEAKWEQNFLKALWFICREITFSDACKIWLINQLLDIKDYKENLSNFQYLQIIFLANRKDLLTKAFDNKELNFKKMIHQLLPEILPLAKFDDSTFDQLIELFFSRRAPFALLVYAMMLKPCNDEKSWSAFQVFIQEVLDQSFSKKRYEDSLHLETIFAKRADLKEKWMKSSEFKLDSEKEEKPTSFSFKEFLKNTLLVNHPISEKNFPLLFSYLKGDYQTKMTKQEQQEDQILAWQQEVIELAEKKHFLSIEELNQLKEKLAKIYPKTEFLNDLQSFSKSYKKGEFTLHETDHYLDLFLCGTDVSDSCQRVDGDPNITKCLLSYVLDGKHRLIAIKDDSDTIVARAILRLMICEDQPVLMLESVYPKTVSSIHKKCIESYAFKRAQELKVRLFKKGEKPHVLHSLSSRAPLEYVDSYQKTDLDDSRIKAGVYTILAAEEILSIEFSSV